MKLTMEWAKSIDACQDGLDWWHDELQENPDPEFVISKMLTANRFDWANWLISRLLTHDNQIKYAIFAAEQVIDIYEKQYPGDDRPRKAIEAAKKYLKSKDRKVVAATAYDAANAAVYAIYAANAATATAPRSCLND